jgi:hypothetical protein
MAASKASAEGGVELGAPYKGEPLGRRGERPGDGRQRDVELPGAEEGFERGSHFRLLFAFDREYRPQTHTDQGHRRTQTNTATNRFA